MNRMPWIERKFVLGLPPGWLPDILERLYGTVPRINNVIKGLNNDQLEFQLEGKWSIKQHIGHLIDLEQLHDGRIDDFIARKEVLRAADMSNVKTNKANHNKRSAENLVEEFECERMQFISRLQQLDDSIQEFESLHPRLKVLMRPVDMAFFTAEHDDHHLASIRELTRLI